MDKGSVEAETVSLDGLERSYMNNFMDMRAALLIKNSIRCSLDELSKQSKLSKNFSHSD